MKRFLKSKYLHFILIVLVLFLINMKRHYNRSPIKINVFKFEQFLNDDEVERIVVINDSLAQVTIKDDAIQTSKHKKGLSTGFLGSSNIKGPHYQFEVGNIYEFKTKLDKALRKGAKFSTKSEKVEEWNPSRNFLRTLSNSDLTSIKSSKPSACECANLIAKNGFITYGDLKKYKSLDGGSNSSVYKEFEKTNNCTEIYDWEDLADCNLN